MRNLRCYYLTTGALLLALAACKTADPKPAPAAPPPRAQAPTLVAAQPASSPALQEEIKPQLDPIAELIAQVEKAFQAGQANYNAGHLDAAKDSFNRAFDLLLQSNFDLRSDPRLRQEFDKVVEGVNNLEMIALQQGDGFSEQKSEPAPIDEANAVTFPVDANIKAKAEAEVRQTRSDLPLVLNDAVASYINYFSTRGKPTLERSLTRGGRYRDMILHTLREEGVPQDLYYLAVAESGFHPLALSRAGARGMWQFMASRASGYGLIRNWWVDERQDPEKSTRAAARHLKDLYQQFGDWHLAMAAYNSGPGNVQQAVQRTGYADFWELYKRSVLPQETRNYVPIILAVTIMAKNPEQYGLDQVTPDPPERVEQVEINYPVDLRLAAECIDASVDRLQELNPSLLRMTTPKEGSFELKLPAGTAEKFQTAIAAIPPEMRVWWRYHKVAPGETLGAIARQYHTSVQAITEVNNLEDDQLRADSKLIIPIAKGKHSPLEAGGLSYAKRPTYYKVRKKDTVLSVADDFGVPAAKLRQWNRLQGNQLRAGRRLRIYRTVATEGRTAEPATRAAKSTKSKKSSTLRASKGPRLRVHKVQPGDTLAGIASTYHTTVSALRESNSMRGSMLHVGDVLVIPTP